MDLIFRRQADSFPLMSPPFTTCRSAFRKKDRPVKARPQSGQQLTGRFLNGHLKKSWNLRCTEFCARIESAPTSDTYWH
jgi:hypothetical protein